jgi:isopenicillin N synthase-like dioxygenase
MPNQLNAISFTQAGTDPDGFARALGDTFARYGFAVIADHGLDQALIDGSLSRFKALFAWDEDRKRQFHAPGGGGARGYTPFGIETAKGAQHHDLKEFWHVGRDLADGHPAKCYMPDNIWPDEGQQPDIAGLRDHAGRLYQAFDRLGGQLLRAIARYLGLADDYFADKVDHGNSILRVIHYPPLAGEVPNVRAGAHEDINVITLLLGAEERGLQLLDKSGTWLDVTPPPNCLCVNIGDMLQRLTNHVLPSTTHRVVNPQPERARFARYSLPFFLHFNPEFEISTLPHCITETNPDRYPEPILAEAYLQQRLREIKLK